MDVYQCSFINAFFHLPSLLWLSIVFKKNNIRGRLWRRQLFGSYPILWMYL